MKQPCVLTYHSLDTSGSVISVHPDTFREQMEILVRRAAPVVPLEQICSTPGGVAITFDDGFQNFYDRAFPILAQYRLPATVFVVSGYCGRSNDWPTQSKTGIPILPLMPWSQLREIAAAGISLGAHSVTHPYLSRLPLAEVEQEWDRCREEIEQRTGRPVTTAAYPYGDSNERVRACAGERFALSFGTRLASVSGKADVTDLPRLDAYYFRSRFWFESLWTWPGNGQVGGAYVLMRGLLREMRGKAFQTK
jgi:peptidoglycan/xylan/chitin deacetylase (PgdA/CDA1 family)